MHFKTTPVFSKKKHLNVDRENGIVKNVVILKEGANKNGTHFGAKYLQALAKGANEQKQGVKSRFGHPNMCSTSLGSFLGRYKNFKFEKNKVFADLHLDPISKKTQVDGKGISMFEYVMDMAENNPDMFGNSIHIPSPEFEKEAFEANGKKFESHIYNGIVASDVVDDPAATDSLFSNSNDLGIIVTDFLDNNPTIFDVIQKDPSIVEDFFDRYTNYLTQFKNNEKMSFLKKLQKKFSANETFDVEETTAAGDIITIVTEDETPKVGDPVNDSEGNPLADGDTVLKDGSTLVIVDGLIAEIIDAEEEEGEGDDEPSNAEVMQSVNKLSRAFSAFQSNYKKDLKENQQGIVLIADQVQKFEAKFSTLAKSVKSQKKQYDAEDTGKKKKFNTTSGYDPDKVREERAKRKNK